MRRCEGTQVAWVTEKRSVVLLGLYCKACSAVLEIQDMVEEASSYLFNATKQRFYFKTIKVVIPVTWTAKSEYQRATKESYEKADVIVADPFLKYGDEPYTLQYGGCGQPGRYIHFTPNFLTNDNLLRAYGSRGRVFVHEWAHLRWGVFDEYNNDVPFYPAGKNEAEATSKTFPISTNYQKVTQFCNKSNHNIRAPNMQNKMCNYRSTWEVIMDSPDFASSSPRSAPPPPPTISLLQAQERVVCLVLDVSGSMNEFNRIDRLRQAAELFIVQIIETGSWVGIVTFNSGASIKTGLQQIADDSVHKTLTASLPTTASGGTNICLGVHEGFQHQKHNFYFTMVRDSNNPSTHVSGGLTFSATDSLDSNGLIDAFSGISSRSGNINQQSIQLESKGQNLSPSRWMYGTVSIDKTVGNDTFFVVTWSVSLNAPRIILTDPEGKMYTETDFVIDNTNIRTARLKIPGTAKAGDWVYKILNTHTEAQGLSITVTTRAASTTVPPVIVKSYVNQETNSYPSPMVFYTEVTQGFLPVVGANVTAIIESASGKSVELELFDDGSGPDILKHDGIYSRYFTSFKENGRHNIKIRVQGKDETVKRVYRQSQALYVSGYVENGEIKLNPLRHHPSEDKIQANVGNFSRAASGGSFEMTGLPPGNPPDVFPPCKITDLEVEHHEDDEFLLSWTAPGNDYDTGKGK
ncbi:hypothetical protein JD844_017652 [Phrynosoma platyrhinos]|uniref:Uncharacterized protein n=1 Tax=Phrynosoma platyrhinos TaxID=52577 RepID=A0ABQ7SMA3_PHRPL|nr:hypothetical protein JD844_017652 [Phrynosoma platyrhinos]